MEINKLNEERLFDNNSSFQTAGRVNFNNSVSYDFPTNEAYKTLRTNILFCGTGVKTIVITASHANEGKSTISIELSKSLADINKKTLLIDADMRKSVILKRSLKSQNILGLSQLLSGQADISQVLYNTQNPNFDVIFSGRFPPNPVELISSDNFKKNLEKFKQMYDYVIIDSPPLGPVIDAAVIATMCDGAIVVVAADETQYQEVASTKEQLNKSRCKILGAIINEIDPKRTRRNNYYKKSYYYYAEKGGNPAKKKK